MVRLPKDSDVKLTEIQGDEQMRFRTFWWGCQILAETKAEGELLRQFYNTMPKTSELLDGMRPDDAGSISILSQGGIDGEFTQSEIDASTFAIAINRGD